MITADVSGDLEDLLVNNNATAIIYKPFEMKKVMQVLEMIKTSDSTVIQEP